MGPYDLSLTFISSFFPVAIYFMAFILTSTSQPIWAEKNTYVHLLLALPLQQPATLPACKTPTPSSLLLPTTTPYSLRSSCARARALLLCS